MAQFTIKAVNPKTRSFQTQHGDFVSYQVMFHEAASPVEVVRKAGGKVPQVGDALEGTIDMSGAHGPKFKQDYQAGRSFGGGSSFGGASASQGSKPAFQRDSDPFTMYLSYAKDLLVSMLETGGYDKEKYQELLGAAINGGLALYNKRPGAKPEPSTTPEQTSLGEIFGEVQVEEPEMELPWDPSGNPTK